VDLLVEAISPSLKSLESALTVEFSRSLTLDEVLDGRIAVDIVLVAEILLDGAINLSNDEGRVRVGLGEFLPGRSKTLAVTTPGGEELDGKRLLGELSIKVLSSKGKNANYLRLLLFLGLETISPSLESLNSAGTAEFNRVLAVDEVLDGRIAVDIVLVAEILLDGAINLSNNKVRVGVGLGEFYPGRSKTLAVTTPGGEELDSKGLLGELSIKGLGSERKDTNFLLLLSGLLLSGLLLSGLLFSRLLLTGELGHVLHVSLNSARNANILRCTTIGDELDGRITADTKTRSKILFYSAIDFTNVEFAVGLLSKLDPSGSETLAVTTPGGKELDQPETLLGLLIKVGCGKNLNLRSFFSHCANNASCKNKNKNRLHPSCLTN